LILVFGLKKTIPEIPKYLNFPPKNLNLGTI
jgi:hypothetical protein